MNENLQIGQNLDNSGQICAIFAYNGNKAREINLPERSLKYFMFGNIPKIIKESQNSQRNRKGAVYMAKIC